MGGGLMQLVAYGAQDVYLTGNAQITFFKVVYRRHTNFATESIEQNVQGTANFGRKLTVEVQRSGDLVTKMYFRTELPALTATGTNKVAWVQRVGHALINSVELQVGGTTVDKHYGDWLNVWHELARSYTHDRGYNRMIGNTEELTTLASTQSAQTLWVPLQFSCCRNDGLALPVIALQYHDIKLQIELNSLDKLVNYSGTSLSSSLNNSSTLSLGSTSVFVDYVYLDNEERKRFAQASHEYLFEQLQQSVESVPGKTGKFRLNLNHPVKELVWVNRSSKFTTGQQFLAYNPKNPELSRVEATKRFVLRCASVISATSACTAGVAFTTSVTGTNLTIFNEINAVSNATVAASSSNPSQTIDTDMVVILGRLLTVEEMSRTISEWAFPSSCLGLGHGQAANDVTVRDWCNFGRNINATGNPTQSAKLELNGHERFTQREGDYFNYVQPWQCHTNCPCDGVNVYSFALNPEEHQPSGTCNMSRIDNANLTVTYPDNYIASGVTSDLIVFAVNYNVLRVMSGMGGLAYSN
jgi:Large eukaryotic DNA virus major capsid protein/Major capsid protein N-terminus